MQRLTFTPRLKLGEKKTHTKITMHLYPEYFYSVESEYSTMRTIFPSQDFCIILSSQPLNSSGSKSSVIDVTMVIMVILANKVSEVVFKWVDNLQAVKIV